MIRWSRLLFMCSVLSILALSPFQVYADSYAEELQQLLEEYPVYEEELDEVAEAQVTEENVADEGDADSISVDGEGTWEITIAEDENSASGTEEGQDDASSGEDDYYLTRRLIVMDSALPEDTCGAVATVSKSDTCHILQYETQEATADAYETLTAAGYQILVDEVVCVDLDSVTATPKDTTSYAPSLMGLDYLAGAINATGGTKITVAVIDTGVNTSSSYLQGRLTSTGLNIISGGTSVTDGNGHGTNVAGIIADCSSDNVVIYPIKAFTNSGSTTYTAIDLAISAAASRADVINMSFSLTSSNALSLTFLNSSLDAAISDGDIVCCAAGNGDDDGNAISINYVYPACYEPIWTIGSVDSAKVRSSYSNYGQYLDFVAPGEDVAVLGLNDRYYTGSGTSYSAPVMVAAAAMALSLGYDADEIYQMFCALCDDLGASGRDDYYGYGLLTLTSANVCACGTDNCPVLLMDGESCDCGNCEITSTKDISTSTFSSVSNKIYKGKARTPSVTVVCDGRTLQKGRHYTVTYKNNNRVGKAKIIIRGIGAYSGKKTITFKILPQKAVIRKLKRLNSTSILVRTGKVTGVTKYQIRYSVNKNMKKSTKVKTAKLKKKIKGLKSGTTYYVQVRAYRKVNGKYYYGKWSKKVKIRL